MTLDLRVEWNDGSGHGKSIPDGGNDGQRPEMGENTPALVAALQKGSQCDGA